jgi:hypothetical protein
MIARDMWMNPGKARLLRRTCKNGFLHPPTGTEVYGTILVGPVTPGPSKLRATATKPPVFAVNKTVIFMPKAATGTQAARMALETLQAAVDTIAGNVVTFRTAPTDLSASSINFTGLVMEVVPTPS